MRLVLNSATHTGFAWFRVIPLSVLRSGETAEILEIVGPAADVRRLEELGLRSGSILEMMQTGSTCIIRVGGSKLCVRHDELLRVMVAPRKSA